MSSHLSTLPTLGGVTVVALLVVAVCLRVAPALPAASPRKLSNGIVLTGAVGSFVAAGTLPDAGLLLVPVVPLGVAYLAFGILARVRPDVPARRPFGAVGLAAVLGVVGLLARGIVGAGVEYVPHVLRPPSLVASSVALSVAALAGYPLGIAAQRDSAWRWLAAALVVGLPVSTVLAVGLRTWNLTGRFVPAVLSATAILLATPTFRLGHAVGSGRHDGPVGHDGPGGEDRDETGETPVPQHSSGGRE